MRVQVRVPVRTSLPFFLPRPSSSFPHTPRTHTMASPSYTYTIPSLSHLSTAINSISTPQLHPVFLPISPLTLVHALRVSVGTTQVQGGKKVGLLQSVALDLILLFGGWSLLNLALGLANPLLDAGNQWVALVYGGIHALACVTGVNSALVGLLQMRDVGVVIDVLMTFVDGVCRMDGIVALGVEPVSARMTATRGIEPARATWATTLTDTPTPLHSTQVRTHPAPLTPLLTSILIGGGGPLLIGLFNLDNPSDWRLRTPTWLTNPTGLLAFDIWSSAFVGWLYLTLSRGASGSASILSQKEATLVSTLVLILLMAGNRLRVEVDQRRGGGSGGNKKRKTSSSNSYSLVLYLGLVLPCALFFLQTFLAGNNLVSSGWVVRSSEEAQ